MSEKYASERVKLAIRVDGRIQNKQLILNDYHCVY